MKRIFLIYYLTVMFYGLEYALNCIDNFQQQVDAFVQYTDVL